MSANAPEPAATVNPYAAPAAEVRPVTPREGAGPDAADTRWHYLGRERLVRRLSFLNDFVAFLHAAGLLMVLDQLLETLLGFEERGSFPGAYRAGLAVSALYLVSAGWANVAVGLGLRRLRPWARWAEMVLAGLFVLAVSAVGIVALLGNEGNAAAIALMLAVVGLWLIGLLVSARTGMVFSPTYAAVIAETPYFRAGSRWPVWVAWGF